MDDDNNNITEQGPKLYFGFMGGPILIGDLGGAGGVAGLKSWETYHPFYIPWVVVETTVPDETAFHAN